MELVVVPVLVMVGATLLVMLAIPLGFLAVSGLYFARRTATWLVPLIRRSAADARRSAADAWLAAVDLGLRAVRQVMHSRLPQALATGALGCALALPAFAAPVRDMEPGWGRYPQQHIADLAGADTEAAAQIGACCGNAQARPPQEQGTNQVRSAPSRATGPASRSEAAVDRCAGSCGPSRERSWSSSKDKSKGKCSSRSKSGKKSKSKD